MAMWELSTRLVRNLAELEQIIQEASVAQASTTQIATPNLYWRGHENEAWSVVPRVYRTASYREADLLWSFVTRGSPRVLNPPPIADKLGWIHLAQHYGLPTRLLDWSLSPLTAFYFSVADPKNDGVDGCIWMLDPHALNQNVFGHPGLMTPNAPVIAAMVEEAFGVALPFSPPATSASDGPSPTPKSDQTTAPQTTSAQPVSASQLLPANQRVAAIAAHEIDLRMLVQQAAFTIHRDGADLCSFATTVPMMKKYIVPKESKGFLRDWLRRAGVSGASLFPDLSALARDLRLRHGGD